MGEGQAGHGRAHPLGRLGGALHIGVDQQHAKFFATQPGHHVGATRHRLQGGGHRTQRGVARGMAQVVIQLLEVVDVHHQQAQRTWPAAQVQALQRQRMRPGPAVQQAGEGVVPGEVAQLGHQAQHHHVEQGELEHRRKHHHAEQQQVVQRRAFGQLQLGRAGLAGGRHHGACAQHQGHQRGRHRQHRTGEAAKLLADGLLLLQRQAQQQPGQQQRQPGAARRQAGFARAHPQQAQHEHQHQAHLLHIGRRAAHEAGHAAPHQHAAQHQAHIAQQHQPQVGQAEVFHEQQQAHGGAGAKARPVQRRRARQAQQPRANPPGAAIERMLDGQQEQQQGGVVHRGAGGRKRGGRAAERGPAATVLIGRWWLF